MAFVENLFASTGQWFNLCHMHLTRKLFPWRFIIVLFTCLLSCLADAATPDASADGYMPLANGMHLTMNLKLVGTDGKETRGTAEQRVDGTITRDGQVYHRLVTTLSPDGLPPYTSTRLMRKTPTALYSIPLENPDAKEEVEIQLPLKLGSTWDTKHPQLRTHTVTAKETVIIGDKTFKDCFKISTRSKDGTYQEDFWEAPGIGSIKAEIVSPGMKITLTLRDFKPGK